MIDIQSIKAEMARKNISQMQLSKKLGLSFQTLNLKMRGKRPFKADEISNIARILSVDLNIFFNNNVNK